MQLNHLHRLRDHQYLASVNRLSFFGPDGSRVAEWYVAERHTGHCAQTFIQLINVLPENLRPQAQLIYLNWKNHIDSLFNPPSVVECTGYAGPGPWAD